MYHYVALLKIEKRLVCNYLAYLPTLQLSISSSSSYLKGSRVEPCFTKTIVDIIL